MKYTILNCTPHPVCLFAGALYNQHAGYSIGGKEILRIPPCGVVATAKSSVEILPAVEIDGIEIPLCKRGFTSLTQLPEGGTHYIVSSVYAQAAAALGKNTDNLLVPYGQVKENGKVVGCIGLAQNESFKEAAA